jgi:hypothetical protein
LSEGHPRSTAYILRTGARECPTITAVYLFWNVLWTEKIMVLQFKSTEKPSLKKTVQTKIFRSLKEPFQTASNDKMEFVKSIKQ